MYLFDSSALWRLWRDAATEERWQSAVELGQAHTCSPQRIEMCRSARNLAEFESMSADLNLFYPDVSVPKTIWRWVDGAQHSLARAAVLRAFSVVDLLICGVAAHHRLEIVHDDGDFETAARHLTEIRQRRV